MKTIKCMLLVMLGFSGMLSGAAVAAPTDEQLTREAIQAQRKAIVANAMELTTEEAKGFWPVYDGYWEEENKLIGRTVNLITFYADNWGSVTDEKADAMLKEWFSIEQAELNLKKKYLGKFKRVLPEKKVMRYFQVENKLDAIINLELARGIPLAQ